MCSDRNVPSATITTYVPKLVHYGNPMAVCAKKTGFSLALDRMQKKNWHN
jgi:hypothetical protein